MIAGVAAGALRANVCACDALASRGGCAAGDRAAHPRSAATAMANLGNVRYDSWTPTATTVTATIRRLPTAMAARTPAAILMDLLCSVKASSARSP